MSLILDRADIVLESIRPFFKNGWDELQDEIVETENRLFNVVGLALNGCDLPAEALRAHEAALAQSLDFSLTGAVIELRNLSRTFLLLQEGELSRDTSALALRLSEAIGDAGSIFISRLDLFEADSNRGDYEAAQRHWDILDPMGREWDLRVYRQGEAEYLFARFLFYQGLLTEQALVVAEKAAQDPYSRRVRRKIAELRGFWRISECDLTGARSAFLAAVKLKSESRTAYDTFDIQLLRIELKLGVIAVDSPILELLDPVDPAAEIDLAELRFEMGDIAAARKHTVCAIEWCAGQGFNSPQSFARTRAVALLGRCS